MRFFGRELASVNKGSVIDQASQDVVKFLAEEFIKQHSQEILAKVDTLAIANALAIKVSEIIAANLVKEKKDEQF